MENIDNFELIVSIAGTILSLLLTCVVCIVKIIRNAKQKKFLIDNTLLMDSIAPLMEVAEKYENYSGEEKKQFVLTKINQIAIENHLKFDVEEISKKIEELIVLSKEVNKR